MGKIASSTEYRMDEQFQRRQFLEQNFGFQNSKHYGNLLIILFEKLQKCPKFDNFENRQISEIIQFQN